MPPGPPPLTHGKHQRREHVALARHLGAVLAPHFHHTVDPHTGFTLIDTAQPLTTQARVDMLASVLTAIKSSESLQDLLVQEFGAAALAVLDVDASAAIAGNVPSADAVGAVNADVVGVSPSAPTVAWTGDAAMEYLGAATAVGDFNADGGCRCGGEGV